MWGCVGYTTGMDILKKKIISYSSVTFAGSININNELPRKIKTGNYSYRSDVSYQAKGR